MNGVQYKVAQANPTGPNVSAPGPAVSWLRDIRSPRSMALARPPYTHRRAFVFSHPSHFFPQYLSDLRHSGQPSLWPNKSTIPTDATYHSAASSPIILHFPLTLLRLRNGQECTLRSLDHNRRVRSRCRHAQGMRHSQSRAA